MQCSYLAKNYWAEYSKWVSSWSFVSICLYSIKNPILNIYVNSIPKAKGNVCNTPILHCIWSPTYFALSILEQRNHPYNYVLVCVSEIITVHWVLQPFHHRVQIPTVIRWTRSYLLFLCCNYFLKVSVLSTSIPPGHASNQVRQYLYTSVYKLSTLFDIFTLCQFISTQVILHIYMELILILPFSWGLQWWWLCLYGLHGT